MTHVPPPFDPELAAALDLIKDDDLARPDPGRDRPSSARARASRCWPTWT